MKIFVINLEKDKQRRLDMKSQLDKLGVDYELFTGAYGKSLTSQVIEKICRPKELEKKYSQPFHDLKGLVGCTYSHYLIYKKMVDEHIDCACVMEDDVVISKVFPEVLAWIERNLENDEVISLHTLLYFKTNFKATERSAQGYGIYDSIPPKIRGTQGYVITKSAAKMMLEVMLPIMDFPDCWHRYHLETGLKIRVLFPFPLRHMWIDSVRDDKFRGIKAKLINFIQNRRIFPLWNVIRWRRRKVNDDYIRGFLEINHDPVNDLYLKDINQIRFDADL